MKLSERIDAALARRRLTDKQPAPKPVLPEKPVLPDKQPEKPQPTATVDFATVQEGLQNLSKLNTDEEGSGSFIAKELSIENIRLPMTVGDFVVEDIQRTKTGLIQVQFRCNNDNHSVI